MLYSAASNRPDILWSSSVGTYTNKQLRITDHAPKSHNHKKLDKKQIQENTRNADSRLH